MDIKKLIIKRGLSEKRKWELGKGWLSHLRQISFGGKVLSNV
jgi:hypothetical protein